MPIAKALHTFLGDTIQELRPFLSSEDIGKGARWRTDIGQQLAECNFGILCLTKENLDARWILFEAGALSKLPSGHVTALLAGIQAAAVREPLSQFQHTSITRDDMAKLLADINGLLPLEKRLDAERLKRVFERDWPMLNDKLGAALKVSDAAPAAVPKRDTPSMIAEVLELVRELKRDAEASKTAVTAGAPSWATPYLVSGGALSPLLQGYGAVIPSSAGPTGPTGPVLYLSGSNQPPPAGALSGFSNSTVELPRKPPAPITPLKAGHRRVRNPRPKVQE